MIESRAKPQPSLIRFDNYYHFPQILNQKQITEGGYYAYLARLPETLAEKQNHLKMTAQEIQPRLSQSKILVPHNGQSPAKSIVKHCYPERSKRGQPASSNDS